MIPYRIDFDYYRPGKLRTVYRQWLVAQSPEMSTLLTHPYEGRTLEIAGTRAMEPGGSIVWHVFPERWYDIGAFFLSNEAFTGWYTNFLTPVVMEGTNWSTTDLFLDHWVAVSGHAEWLDVEEFEQAALTQSIDLDAVIQVRRLRDEFGRSGPTGWPHARLPVPDIHEILTTLPVRLRNDVR